MSDTTNISLRFPTDLVARIDHAASQANVSRTEYIASWLPVRYDSPTKPPVSEAQQRQRVANARRNSSPARNSSSV